MLYLNFGQVEFKRLKEQVRDVGMNLRNEFPWIAMRGEIYATTIQIFVFF